MKRLMVMAGCALMLVGLGVSGTGMATASTGANLAAFVSFDPHSGLPFVTVTGSSFTPNSTVTITFMSPNSPQCGIVSPYQVTTTAGTYGGFRTQPILYGRLRAPVSCLPASIGAMDTNGLNASTTVTSASSPLGVEKRVHTPSSHGSVINGKAHPGDTLTYLVFYAGTLNTVFGSTGLPVVTITDVLQSGQTVSSCTSPGCTYSGHTVKLHGSFPAGQNNPNIASFAVTVNQNFTGTLSNMVTVVASVENSGTYTRVQSNFTTVTVTPAASAR